jgi:hypothetical protein
MIENEGTKPELLGYDRPSNKFLSFLTKHYNLKDYVPQSNNFVVFNEYFIAATNSKKSMSNIDLVTVKRDKSPDFSRKDNNTNYIKKDYFKLDKPKQQNDYNYRDYNERDREYKDNNRDDAYNKPVYSKKK